MRSTQGGPGHGRNDGTGCPCGSGFALAACCAPFIAGLGKPGSATALMRSRYTAHTTCNSSYLLRTWHPATRPARIELDPLARWLGLSIRTSEGGEAGDLEGRVEFVARFKRGGRAHRLHENSRFLFEDGRWYYVDGKTR